MYCMYKYRKSLCGYSKVDFNTINMRCDDFNTTNIRCDKVKHPVIFIVTIQQENIK